MALGRLGITNIRNIKLAELSLSAGVNLVYGANGSGKTSLLEAVYFLGSGRTFRSQSADPLIRHSERVATVYGEVVSENGRGTRLGVQRSRTGDRLLRINGEAVQRSSELARLLPTLVLGPQSIELVSGSPGLRRRFLNWGVFHVEHSFNELWEQYSRSLRQRNQLLKNGRVSAKELEPWTESVSRLAQRVDVQRQSYFDAFVPVFEETLGRIMGENSVESRYYRGWESGRSLDEILAEQEDADRRRGFTQSGPHRADIRLRVAGQNAANLCSRGELKVIAWALILAQGNCFTASGSGTLTYLVDDLGAELDANHRDRVCRILERPGNQVIVTGIERSQLENNWYDPKLFHVEHGTFHAEETTG